MSDCPFKVGDRVVVRAFWGADGYFKPGDKGTVFKIPPHSAMVKVIMDGQKDDWQFEHIRFSLLQEKPKGETYTIKSSSPYLIDYPRIYRETISPEVHLARVKGPHGYILMVRRDIIENAFLRQGFSDFMEELSPLVYIGEGDIPWLSISEWGRGYDILKALMAAPLYKDYKEDVEITVETFSK